MAFLRGIRVRLKSRVPARYYSRHGLFDASCITPIQSLMAKFSQNEVTHGYFLDKQPSSRPIKTAGIGLFRQRYASDDAGGHPDLSSENCE